MEFINRLIVNQPRIRSLASYKPETIPVQGKQFCLKADDIFVRNIKKGSEALRSYINSEVVKELNKLMPSHIDLTGEDHVDLTDDGETEPSCIDLTEETSSSEHLPNEKQLTPVMEVMNPATEVNKENAIILLPRNITVMEAAQQNENNSRHTQSAKLEKSTNLSQFNPNRLKTPQNPKPDFCELCQVNFGSVTKSVFSIHMNGKKHQTNLKTLTLKGGNVEIHCELCNVTCVNYEAYAAHKAGKSHVQAFQSLNAREKSLSVSPTVLSTKQLPHSSSTTTNKLPSASKTDGVGSSDNSHSHIDPRTWDPFRRTDMLVNQPPVSSYGENCVHSHRNDSNILSQDNNRTPNDGNNSSKQTSKQEVKVDEPYKLKNQSVTSISKVNKDEENKKDQSKLNKQPSPLSGTTDLDTEKNPNPIYKARDTKYLNKVTLLPSGHKNQKDQITISDRGLFCSENRENQNANNNMSKPPSEMVVADSVSGIGMVYRDGKSKLDTLDNSQGKSQNDKRLSFQQISANKGCAESDQNKIKSSHLSLEKIEGRTPNKEKELTRSSDSCRNSQKSNKISRRPPSCRRERCFVNGRGHLQLNKNIFNKKVPDNLDQNEEELRYQQIIPSLREHVVNRQISVPEKNTDIFPDVQNNSLNSNAKYKHLVVSLNVKKPVHSDSLTSVEECRNVLEEIKNSCGFSRESQDSFKSNRVLLNVSEAITSSVSCFNNSDDLPDSDANTASPRSNESLTFPATIDNTVKSNNGGLPNSDAPILPVHYDEWVKSNSVPKTSSFATKRLSANTKKARELTPKHIAIKESLPLGEIIESRKLSTHELDALKENLPLIERLNFSNSISLTMKSNTQTTSEHFSDVSLTSSVPDRPSVPKIAVLPVEKINRSIAPIIVTSDSESELSAEEQCCWDSEDPTEDLGQVPVHVPQVTEQQGQSVASVLSCSVCGSWVFSHQVLFCQCRLICESCQRSRGLCELCHTMFQEDSRLRNLHKRLAGNIPHPCAHPGCSRVVRPGSDHELNCPYTPTKCFKCEEIVPTVSLRHHYDLAHPGAVLRDRNPDVKYVDFIKSTPGDSRIMFSDTLRHKLCMFILLHEVAKEWSFLVSVKDTGETPCNISATFEFKKPFTSYTNKQAIKMTNEPNSFEKVVIPSDMYEDWSLGRNQLEINFIVRKKRGYDNSLSKRRRTEESYTSGSVTN